MVERTEGGSGSVTTGRGGGTGRTVVERAIRELAPWFHNLHLPGGLQTAPGHRLGDFPAFKWRELAPHLPDDLSGWRVLDIGCNAGFYSFQLARRGARVIGIDVDPHYLAQAQWARAQYRLEDRVEFRRMQAYDLARVDDAFDIVLFLGVFYHLRYPLLGLDIAAHKVKRLFAFQSLTMPGVEVAPRLEDGELDERDVFLQSGWPRMAFIEGRFAGDPTNWWAPNHAAIEAMLRSTGLRVRSRPAHEMYVCEPDPDADREAMARLRAELRAATGTTWSRQVGDRSVRGDRSRAVRRSGASPSGSWR